jgi:hypothetical protein
MLQNVPVLDVSLTSYSDTGLDKDISHNLFFEEDIDAIWTMTMTITDTIHLLTNSSTVLV